MPWSSLDSPHFYSPSFLVVVDFFGIGNVWTSRVSNTALAIFFFTYFPFYQRRRAVAALITGWANVPILAFATYALGISWLLFLAALGFLFTIRQSRS